MNADRQRRPPKDLHLSNAGAQLIADREGMELTAYLDNRGILTIGIGHTSAAGPPRVAEGMTISEDEAWSIFRADNARFRHECVALVKAPLHQHEFDALASFVFNLGSPQFSGSTALKRLNADDYEGCAEAMLWWSKPPEIRSRRQAEHDQFLDLRHVARA
jgi:lysozyme